MKGIYDSRQQKRDITIDIVGIVAAIFFIWLGIEAKTYILGGVSAGLLILGVVILILKKKNQYFYVDNNSVKIKTVFFGIKEIPIADILTVSRIAPTQKSGAVPVIYITETSGKKHCVEGLANSSEIYSHIKRCIRKNTTQRSGIAVATELKTIRKKRISALSAVAGGVLLMIAGLFWFINLLNMNSDIFSTEQRSLVIIAVIEIAALAVIFCFLKHSSRLSEFEKALQNELGYRYVFYSELPKGNAVKVFTDNEYTVRYTVFEDELTKQHSYIEEKVLKNGSINTSEVIPFINDSEYNDFLIGEASEDISDSFFL